MITIFILSWFFSLITFVVGFYMGKGTLTKETYQSIKKQLDHKILPQYKQPSGLVMRPDAKRIRELNNPQIQEEADAMREVLADLDNVQPLTK